MSMPLVEKVDSVLILKILRILAGYPLTGHIIFNPVHVKDITGTARGHTQAEISPKWS